MEPNSHIEEQQFSVSELATPISEDGSAELSKSTNGDAQNGSPEGESETRSSRGGKRRRRGGGELANLIGATVAGANEEALLYNQFLMDRPKRSTRLGDNRVLTYNESALFQQFATSSYSTPSSRTSSGGGASRATTGRSQTAAQRETDQKKRRRLVPCTAPDNVVDVIHQSHYPVCASLGYDEGEINGDNTDLLYPQFDCPAEREGVNNNPQRQHNKNMFSPSASPLSPSPLLSPISNPLPPSGASEEGDDLELSTREDTVSSPSLQKMSIATLLLEASKVEDKEFADNQQQLSDGSYQQEADTQNEGTKKVQNFSSIVDILNDDVEMEWNQLEDFFNESEDQQGEEKDKKNEQTYKDSDDKQKYTEDSQTQMDKELKQSEQMDDEQDVKQKTAQHKDPPEAEDWDSIALSEDLGIKREKAVNLDEAMNELNILRTKITKLKQLHRVSCFNEKINSCNMCAVFDCPFGNSLHYDKQTGCPSCKKLFAVKKDKEKEHNNAADEEPTADVENPEESKCNEGAAVEVKEGKEPSSARKGKAKSKTKRPKARSRPRKKTTAKGNAKKQDFGGPDNKAMIDGSKNEEDHRSQRSEDINGDNVQPLEEQPQSEVQNEAAINDEKLKKAILAQLNNPNELPNDTVRSDKAKAIIDKTLEKEGKSVTAGYWKDPYNWAERTYINCDLRYYNLAALGKFDVIMIDPPWRIKGNQLISSEKTMFNNSRWALSYGTLSNEEILDIDVGSLSDKGFIFIWVINSQLEFGLKCLREWGYTYIDRLTWVKRTATGNIAISQGYYFLHSTETCLVGVKCNKEGKSLEFISKMSNDVIFAELREKSRKPDQIYHIIERMVPGGRKIELFARNHNMRPGWLSLGNQLGEYFDWDHDLICCDVCGNRIPTGQTRYKSRQEADKDLCGQCYQKSGGTLDDFFEVENILSEMAFHQYFACDGCETKPIWGLRFHCTECDDCDLCELCYDKKLVPPHLKDKHKVSHKFEVIEIPDLAGGLPVHHSHRCMGCQTKPIVGYRFSCFQCNGLSLCQKCFFLRKEPRNHRADHKMDLLTDEHSVALEKTKCMVCGYMIEGVMYKCKSCFNYDLCERCHDEKAPPPLTNLSHKPSHKFKKLEMT